MKLLCQMILRGDEAGIENVGEIKFIDIAGNQIPDGIRQQIIVQRNFIIIK